MLLRASKFINLPVLSVQAGGQVAYVAKLIIDPNDLKIIAFVLGGPLMNGRKENILDARDVREYSDLGFIIDSVDDLVAKDDVINIEKVVKLNFELVGLRVESKKHSRLGKVVDFFVTDDNLLTQQIIVKRPALKSFSDSELTIPRAEIVEITDYKIIVKDEEKKIREVSENEEFIPNFVNPFREKRVEPDYAPAHNQTPDVEDTE